MVAILTDRAYAREDAACTEWDSTQNTLPFALQGWDGKAPPCGTTTTLNVLAANGASRDAALRGLAETAAQREIVSFAAPTRTVGVSQARVGEHAVVTVCAAVRLRYPHIHTHTHNTFHRSEMRNRQFTFHRDWCYWGSTQRTQPPYHTHRSAHRASSSPKCTLVYRQHTSSTHSCHSQRRRVG